MPLDADLNDVLVFTRVVESRSFTAAGRALSMPRSTVSRRIAQLERQLGARLLQRTTRRLQLTELGASYYERCAAALETIGEAEAIVKEAQLTPKGSLRVTAPHDIGAHLAPLVASFICKHRQVQIAVELSQHVVDLIAEGFDLAIRASPALPESSLVARRVASGHGALYASRPYLERAGTPSAPEDLSRHAVIALGRRRQHVTWTLVREGQRIEVPVTPSIWVNDPGFARECAAAHAGIAYLPADGERSALTRVLPGWHPDREASLYVVYPSAKHLSATVRAFRDHLVEGLASRVLFTPAASHAASAQ